MHVEIKETTGKSLDQPRRTLVQRVLLYTDANRILCWGKKSMGFKNKLSNFNFSISLISFACWRKASCLEEDVF